jgi:hypothetical protein
MIIKISSDNYFFESHVMGRVETSSYTFGEGETLELALLSALQSKQFHRCYAVDALLEIYTPESRNIVNHPKEIIVLCRHKHGAIKEHYINVSKEIKDAVVLRMNTATTTA